MTLLSVLSVKMERWEKERAATRLNPLFSFYLTACVAALQYEKSFQQAFVLENI